MTRLRILVGIAFLVAAAGALAQDLRVDVILINLFVTVQNPAGEFVTSLTRDDFAVYDDGEAQEVRVFEKEHEVQSAIGLLIDSSGSMVDILPLAKAGVRDFSRTLGKGDDYFVTSFGTNLRLLRNFGGGAAGVLDRRLDTVKAWGVSVLLDALDFGVEKASESQIERKALIVFTDGHDNGSVTELRDLRDRFQRSIVLLYFVAVGPQRLIDRSTLEDLSSLSGGRTHYVGKNENIPNVLRAIRTELANQYYLGYYVPRRPGPHRIRVEVPGRDLKIRARTGYTF